MADFNLGFELYEPVFFVVVVDESLTISYFLDLREVGVRPQRESIALIAQSNLKEIFLFMFLATLHT